MIIAKNKMFVSKNMIGKLKEVTCKVERAAR